MPTVTPSRVMHGDAPAASANSRCSSAAPLPFAAATARSGTSIQRARTARRMAVSSRMNSGNCDSRKPWGWSPTRHAPTRPLRAKLPPYPPSTQSSTAGWVCGGDGGGVEAVDPCEHSVPAAPLPHLAPQAPSPPPHPAAHAYHGEFEDDLAGDAARVGDAQLREPLERPQPLAQVGLVRGGHDRGKACHAVHCSGPADAQLRTRGGRAGREEGRGLAVGACLRTTRAPGASEWQPAGVPDTKHSMLRAPCACSARARPPAPPPRTHPAYQCVAHQRRLWVHARRSRARRRPALLLQLQHHLACVLDRHAAALAQVGLRNTRGEGEGGAGQ